MFRRDRFFSGFSARAARLVATALLAAVVVPAAGTVAAGEGIEVVYLGNEGFLVQAGETKVLVDALQGPGLEGYVTLPNPTRASLEAAEPPFDGIDLVLITHHHPDHFDIESVSRFLRANPDAELVSTGQTARRLSHEPAFGNRVKALEPRPGEPVAVRAGGVDVQVFALHHGTSSDVANLGFLVEQGGVRWLHVGDTAVSAEELTVESFPRREVDVWFVPYWHLLDDELAAKRDAVGAKRIVAMHVPSADAPQRWFGDGGSLESLIDALEARGDDVVVFRKLLDRRRF